MDGRLYNMPSERLSVRQMSITRNFYSIPVTFLTTVTGARCSEHNENHNRRRRLCKSQSVMYGTREVNVSRKTLSVYYVPVANAQLALFSGHLRNTFRMVSNISGSTYFANIHVS